MAVIELAPPISRSTFLKNRFPVLVLRTAFQGKADRRHNLTVKIIPIDGGDP